MVLAICGLLISLLGAYNFNKTRVPKGSVLVDGVVVEVSTFRSATRSGKVLYAPVVEFQDPMTGQTSTVKASGHNNKKPTVGDNMTVYYEASTQSAMLGQKLLRRLGLLVVGLSVFALGVASMAGILESS